MPNTPAQPAAHHDSPQNSRLALVEALDIAYHAVPGPFVMATARLAGYIEDVADERGATGALDAIASARAYLDAAHAVCIEARRTEALAAIVAARAEALAYGREATAALLSVLAERVASGACDGDLGRAEARVAEVRESLRPIDAQAVAS